MNHPKLKIKVQKTEVPIGALTLYQFCKMHDVKRTTLQNQIKRGYWVYNGSPGAVKVGKIWLFWPEATLVFPTRRGGPGRPKGMKNKVKKEIIK